MLLFGCQIHTYATQKITEAVVFCKVYPERCQKLQMEHQIPLDEIFEWRYLHDDKSSLRALVCFSNEISGNVIVGAVQRYNFAIVRTIILYASLLLLC